MNILIIPSWYPSTASASTGIFFREQAEALARHYPKSNIGISTWGQNEPGLLMEGRNFAQWPTQVRQAKNLLPTAIQLQPNCVEYQRPTLTWSRRWRRGNMQKILEANAENAQEFEAAFGKIDVIHAHVAHPGGYVAMKLAQRLEVPYLVTEHMSPFPMRSYQSTRTFDRWLRPPLERSHTNIAVSTALQHKMKERGIESIVVPNLVDEDFFVPIEGDDPYELLAIGRLEEQKGLDVLLSAFHGVRATHPQHRLTIIGSGSLDSSLKRQAGRMGLKRHIRWHGEGSRKDVLAALQRASFLVLPSLHESMGVVLVEALACGKPIIATRCRGPEEIVNQQNGLLAEPDDPRDMRNKIIELIDNRVHYDSQVIRRDFERRFASAVVTEQLMQVYQRLALIEF